MWRDFLKCQSSAVWNNDFLHKLGDLLHNFMRINWNEEINSSYLETVRGEENELSCAQALNLLRETAFLETLPLEERISTGEVMRGVRTLAENKGTITEKLWLLYYISRNDMLFSKDVQLAINSALMIIETAQYGPDEEKQLGVALFLLAWGSLQYRLGNCEEGIACCISAISMKLDPIPLMEDAFNIVARYIGDQARAGADVCSDSIYLDFLESISTYNQTAAVIVDLIRWGVNSESRIQMLQTRVRQREHDQEWMLDLTNLVQMLCKSGDKKGAAQYILNNIGELQDLVGVRSDASHDVLFIWSNTLLNCDPNYKNILICKNLLEMAIERGVDRRSAFHQDERAGISISFNRIIKEYLFVCGALYMSKDIDEEKRGELKADILKASAQCVPSSIIEQKDYHMNLSSQSTDTEEMMALEQLKSQYYELREYKSSEDQEVQALAKKIRELTERVVQTNRMYRPLSKFCGTRWDDVKKTLSKEDIAYQFILCERMVITILCTHLTIMLNVRMVVPPSGDTKTIMTNYGEMVDTGIPLDEYSKELTKLVASPLMDYLEVHSVDRLFVIPEMNCNAFPLSAARRGDVSIIDRVNEIVNVVDYRAIERYTNNKCAASFFPAFNRVYGNSSDMSIAKLKSWLKTKECKYFIFEYRDDDNSDPLFKNVDLSNVETVAIYGHGAQAVLSEDMDGAFRIAGKSRLIDIEPLIRGLDVKNLILISCLSGAINEKTAETAKGIWKSVFEQYSGNIVLCKWSVPTVSTIDLMNYVYEYMKQEGVSLGSALILAQRDMNNRSLDSKEWAGVEFWIN